MITRIIRAAREVLADLTADAAWWCRQLAADAAWRRQDWQAAR